METVAPPPVETELNLLTEWDSPGDASRRKKAAALSVAGHAVAIALLATVHISVRAPEAEEGIRRVTPLVAPPTELTQRAPNKHKVTKEFDAVEELQRPRIQIPLGAPSTTRPRAFRPADIPQPAPVKAAAPLPEAPKVEPAAPKTEVPQIAQATPQIEAVEKPKIALENPAAPPAPVPPGQRRVAIPDASVSEAIRQAVPGRVSGGLTVGDLDLPGLGGIGAGINLPPSPGMQGSNLELLSDPQGVDFRAYLIQVLTAVRRNWLAVYPESAKLGLRGRVALLFSINRRGGVPKLTFASQSGSDALDRAAVAGISASEPFPPLPAEYKGDVIVVQLNFSYNIPRR